MLKATKDVADYGAGTHLTLNRFGFRPRQAGTDSRAETCGAKAKD